MRRPSPATGGDDDLFEEITAISAQRISRGVGKVERLTPEDAEALTRGSRHRIEATWGNVQSAAMWAGLALLICLMISALGLLVVLMWSYGRETISAGKAGPVIAAILQFIFGAVATLAIEGLRKSRD